MPIMSDRKRVMMWLVAAVRGPFQSVQLGGILHVAVVKNVTTQEVGYLLDEALGKDSEFSVWASYCGGHDGNAVLDFCQLGIEVIFWAKAGEPTGDPRRWKLVVSLAGRDGPRGHLC